MVNIEKKIEKLKTDLVQLDKEWEQRQEQLKQTFNQELGVYVGRKSAIEEVLTMLTQDDDEKKEENEQEVTENAPKTIVEE